MYVCMYVSLDRRQAQAPTWGNKLGTKSWSEHRGKKYCLSCSKKERIYSLLYSRKTQFYPTNSIYRDECTKNSLSSGARLKLNPTKHLAPWHSLDVPSFLECEKMHTALPLHHPHRCWYSALLCSVMPVDILQTFSVSTQTMVSLLFVCLFVWIHTRAMYVLLNQLWNSLLSLWVWVPTKPKTVCMQNDRARL